MKNNIKAIILVAGTFFFSQLAGAQTADSTTSHKSKTQKTKSGAFNKNDNINHNSNNGTTGTPGTATTPGTGTTYGDSIDSSENNAPKSGR